MIRQFRAVCAGLFLALFLAAPLVAQGDATPNVEVWENVATRAEAVVDEGTGTDEVLENLRKRIADFRSEFDAARGVNAERIATLRQQITALTPAPEGENADPEAPEVAKTREDLTQQLNALLAPVQIAERDYARADGLIREIDQIIRDRQTEKLLSSTPSPLNPVHWAPAFRELDQSFAAIWIDRGAVGNQQQMDELRSNLPLVVFTTILGLLLLFRGRRWALMIVNSLRRHKARGLGIWRFIVSLLRIFLPLGGVFLLVIAARKTGYLGVRSTEVIGLLPLIGVLTLGFRWVSERVFSRDDEEALLLLPEDQRRKARFYVSGITLVMIVSIVTSKVLSFDTPSAATRAVVGFPFAFLISVALFRIGQILRSYTDAQDDAEDPDLPTRSSTHARFVRSLGLGAIAVALLSPVLFAFGYQDLADAILGPYVTTLVILGLVMALQRFSADVYGAITGQGIAARDALMPVFFGLVLLLCAMPALALIWGARVADLTEIWTAFARGFAVGDTRISPTNLLTFAIIFAIGYLITRLLQGTLRSNVLPKTQIDIGGQNALLSGLGYVGIFLAALAAITGAGIDLSSLAIVAGALSVGIGFGLQNIVSNFVSGIILLIERPISEGDWIEVGGKSGYVRDISVRSTRIETFDRTDVIVPNADLVSGTVTNFTRGNTVGRVLVPVGVAYGTDTKKVDAILREIAEAQPMVLANPAPNVLFLNFGADALEFEIRAFLRDVNWMMNVKSDINHAIAARFAEENIEVPFAQRDIWLRNPEALRPGPVVSPPTTETTDNLTVEKMDNLTPEHTENDVPEGTESTA
ncbi:DUF3772 domain-containing protein [Sulfitobacter sp.]|uniref:DUF3772 domain-containing protein n=1 Tax=Sulfitobacter sp. TaxID=1903071 RepID=UPI00356A5E9C